MRSAQIVSVFALAGAAVAMPWGNWGGNNEGSPKATATAVATEIAYTTVTIGGKWGHGRPTATPVATSAAQAWSTWVPSAPATPSAAPGGSTSGGYMDIVNEFRSKMGHSQLSHDSQLEANALKTAQDGNGQMVHELNDGSMAQVLAPGSADEFEKVYVGGWLCEVPGASGLDGICSSMSAGWSYDGQTGHADILSSSDYSKIGCSCATGIWACDLA